MFVKKPGQWESMSAEDRAWFKGLSRGNAYESMLQAIDEKNEFRAKIILSRRRFKTGKERLHALLHAIDAKSPSLCEEVLLTARGRWGWGWDFDQYSDKNLLHAKEVLRKLIAQDDAALWRICLDSRHWRYELTNKIVSEVLLEQPVSDKILTAQFEIMDYEDTRCFFLLYQGVREKYPDQTDVTLKFVDKFCSQGKLKFLKEAATIGDAVLLNRMLAIWHDIHPEEAFYAALDNKQDECIRALLPFLDLKRCLGNIRALLDSNIQDPDLRQKALRAFDAAHSVLADVAYARIDDQTLAEVKKISNDLRITTLFNFHFAKETTIIEKTGNTALLTSTVRDFSDISQTEVLEEMRQKLIDLKGNPDALEAFPARQVTLVGLKKPNSRF